MQKDLWKQQPSKTRNQRAQRKTVKGDTVCKKLDLTGERYGNLLVIEKCESYVHPSGRKRTRWLCRCDCGNYDKVTTDNLRSGQVTSCGCTRVVSNKQRLETHGLSSERLYGIWTHMKDRCYNENNERYKSYCGKGIKICDAWLHDYVAFRTWMLENGYDPDAKYGETTIDRIDVNGDYCPENCRVVNMTIQNRNKTNTLMYTYHDETKSLPEWAEEYGLKYSTLRARIKTSHWDIETALLTPVVKGGMKFEKARERTKNHST